MAPSAVVRADNHAWRSPTGIDPHTRPPTIDATTDTNPSGEASNPFTPLLISMPPPYEQGVTVPGTT
jgi:hypothetical protein